MNTSILKIPALATAIVVTVALTACGSATKNSASSQSPATSTQSGSPTTTEALPEPITPAERRWIASLKRYSNRIQRDIRLGGAVTHASMARSAKLYAECSRTLRWTGDPGRFESAARLGQRACDRLKRAAGLLQEAIDASDPGGAVVAGTPEEQQFNRGLHGAFEAAGNAQYDLHRAVEKAAAIEASVKS